MELEKVLALDSLTDVLTTSERMYLQKQRTRVYENDFCSELPKNAIYLAGLIRSYNWSPPEIKYNEDRCKMFLSTENWKTIESYNHPILQEAINLK